MLLRFGDCALDPEALELRRGGEAVALSPRAFRLLLLLLQGRPRTLSCHPEVEGLSISTLGRVAFEDLSLRA
jgi:DNA-binding response OmpR family regulator